MSKHTNDDGIWWQPTWTQAMTDFRGEPGSFSKTPRSLRATFLGMASYLLETDASKSGAEWEVAPEKMLI